jgi:hypothetical protein
MTELTVNQVDVAKLSVGPGETLMVQYDGTLTHEMTLRVRDAFRRAFEACGGIVPPILMVDKNFQVSVVKTEEAE